MKKGFITVTVNGKPDWSVFMTTALNVLVIIWLLAEMALTISKLSAQGWVWNNLTYMPYVTLAGLTVAFIYVLSQTLAQIYGFGWSNWFTVVLATAGMPVIIGALIVAEKIITKVFDK